MERPLQDLNEHEALRLILEGTSPETGERFFRALVRALSLALKTHGAWVTELDPRGGRLNAFALWLNGGWIDDFSYAIKDTPCERVVRERRPVHVPDNVVELYPRDPDLLPFKAVSYLGVPLIDAHGEVIGNLAVIDTRPMPEEPRALAVIKIFAARAAAEISRLRAEQALRGREQQVRGLVDSALDAIVQLDADLNIVRVNPAAERVFGRSGERVAGVSFLDLLAGESGSRLRRYADSLSSERRTTWLSGGLDALRADGSAFPAQASIATYEVGEERFFTVIMHDEEERRQAERRIESLSKQTEALRQELRALEGPDEIIGTSPPMVAMMEDVAQVAGTDASVLIQGETGTGKELVARAIHAASQRRERPLIRLNCGAIPEGLVESELFGHERGAFTGATAQRDGRFLLAHNGTLFLDEIGELPLDLQVKLLRVLQEGEFEPVGSSRTVRVDVRVIAATNRDLEAEAKEGRFREDLYYRLSVFPIRVPPLRDRPEDIPPLARAFVERCAARIGRRVDPLSPEDVDRLRRMEWPGNVRELSNVIERAVITSRDGRPNLERALGAPPRTLSHSDSPHPSDERVRTASEMEDLERENLLRALERAGWKVAGKDGAAALLGISASTLSYRIKALGIRRPK